MQYYTEIVPAELVEKLYKVGCPNIGRYEEADGSVKYSEATYADIFDGLIEKGVAVVIFPNDKCQHQYKWAFSVPDWIQFEKGWHEAANAAIEKAIEILKEQKK